ncbi:MAG TPA: hypothetical protein VEH77_03695, partial [Roseiarcus sp.]|nr:hypothetical protein [Roseiarcus sp.]
STGHWGFLATISKLSKGTWSPTMPSSKTPPMAYCDTNLHGIPALADSVSVWRFTISRFITLGLIALTKNWNMRQALLAATLAAADHVSFDRRHAFSRHRPRLPPDEASGSGA